MSERRNHWLYLPVFGLRFGKKKRHINVGSVCFFDKAILKTRAKQRAGLKIALSDIEKRTSRRLFDSSTVFAVTRSSESEEGRSKAIREIWNAFYLLASTFHFWTWRDQIAISLTEDRTKVNLQDILLLHSNNKSFQRSKSLTSATQPNDLSGFWLENQKWNFTKPLLNLLNGKSTISSNWKKTLIQACRLVGRSQLSSTRSEAFINNMIAIECILAARNENTEASFVSKLSAIFEFVDTESSDEKWKGKVKRLYQLRCDVVHRGAHELVDGSALMEADEIAANLLTAILHNLKTFSDRDALDQFVERARARKLLGLKREISGFSYMSYVQDENVRKRIKQSFRWE